MLLLIFVFVDYLHSYTKHSLSSVTHLDDSPSLSSFYLLYSGNSGLHSVNFQTTVRAVEYVLSHTWNPADQFYRCVCSMYNIDVNRDMISMLIVVSSIAHLPQTLPHVFSQYFHTESFFSYKLSLFLRLTFIDFHTSWTHTHTDTHTNTYSHTYIRTYKCK